MKLKSKMRAFSRRRFLRGTGKFVLPLPFLECFLNSNGTAYANGNSFTPNYVFANNGLTTMRDYRVTIRSNDQRNIILNNNGYTINHSHNGFYPLKFGSNYDLPIALKSFGNLKSDINIITNLAVGMGDGSPGAFGKGIASASHHTIGRRGVLGGRTGMPATNENNRINGGTTAEHKIHAHINKGKLTHTSVEAANYWNLQRENITNFSVSWKGNAFVEPTLSLSELYQELFAGQNNANPSDGPSKKDLKRLQLADLVLKDLNSIKRELSSSDRALTDSFLEGLNSMKKSILEVNPVGENCPEISPPENVAIGTKKYNNEKERALILNKMIATAAQCGISHVFTQAVLVTASRMNIWELLGADSKSRLSKGSSARNIHDCTHDFSQDAFIEVQSWANSVFADLVQQFKNINVGSGTLLDHSNLLYMVEAGYGKPFDSDFGLDNRQRCHSVDNMFMINAGGKSLGINLGKHINGNRNHPLSVVNAAMASMGMNNPSVGDVTAVLSDVKS